jgi:lipooligosaccharide transport system ATP-binding protein
MLFAAKGSSGQVPPMPILRVDGAVKCYGGVPVVNNVSFELQRGECFGLLGPNGAGKTTTLRLCLGLTDPDGGDIQMLGQPVPKAAREARVRVGIVPQIDSLDPEFSVIENLLVYGRYFSLSDRLIRERIPSLLEFASLQGKAHSPISTLSGGMRRRLILARALINDPDLIFLDEPTTGLDPQARHLIWERLRRLLNQRKTILLTTHFMDEAERLCNRLLIMDRGKTIASGSPRQLIKETIEPEVVEVYGERVDAWLKEKGSSLSDRAELTGETAFCYIREAGPLLADLQLRSGLRYLHRPANLEDVFLKLTGREMRD